MADNIIRLIIEGGGSFGGGGAGTPNFSSDRADQMLAAFSEIAKKMDKVLSDRSATYTKAKDPDLDQLRKIELLNAKEKTALNVLDRKNKNKEAEQLSYRKTALDVVGTKAQTDVNRIRENTLSQQAIQAEKRRSQEHQNNLKEQKSQADHNRRLELKHLDNQNRSKLAGGAIAGVVAATLSSLGKTFGNSAVTYGMGNSLVRPDLAMAQLNMTRMGALQGLASSGLIAGGAAIGASIGGAPGGVIGGTIAGIGSAALNMFAPQLIAGYQMANQTEPYMNYLPQYSYGGSYSGVDPNFVKNMMVQPGGKETLPYMYNQYYGSVGNSAAMESAATGSLKYAYLTGNQQNLPALINPLSNILKMSGMGDNPQSTQGLFKTLTQYQRQYGGDTVSNLQLIARLLQSSGINNVPLAANLVYGSQAMNPALAVSATNYASSSRISQFTQAIMAKAFLGVDINSVMGMNGTDAQRKELAKIQAMDIGQAGGPLTEGGIMSSSFPWFYEARNANLKNQQTLQNSSDPIGNLISRVFSGDTIKSFLNLYDPITQKQSNATSSMLGEGEAPGNLLSYEKAGLNSYWSTKGLTDAIIGNTKSHTSLASNLSNLQATINNMKGSQEDHS